MKKIVLVIMIFLMFVSISFASTITFNSTSGFYIDYQRDSRGFIAMAGERNISLDGFESVAYCVELGIPHSNGEVTLINPINYNAFEREWTQQGSYNNYYNGMYAAWLMDQYSTGLGYDNYMVDKNIADAALQIAIWYTLYNFNPNDGSFDDTYFHNMTYRNNISYFVPSSFPSSLSDGGDYSNFSDGYKEESAWIIAQNYYSNLQNRYNNDNLEFSGNYEFFVAQITDDSDYRHQTHLIARSTVPEPNTIFLFGIGLLGLARISRKDF